MLVVLFRHGPAGHFDTTVWPDDRMRPLTERGARRTRRAARGLAGLIDTPARIVASPLERAAATATILHQVLRDESTLVTDELLAPGMSMRDVMHRLGTFEPGATAVLVGHEPDLGRLAGVMLFGAPRAIALKKAGACGIDFVGVPAAGEGELRWFLGPRVLRGLRHRAGRRKVGC